MKRVTLLNTITYGIHRSPFGWCVIGIAERDICYFSFIKTNSEKEAKRSIKSSWPEATLARNDAQTKNYIAKIFGRKNSKTQFHLLVKGTDFQIKVWNALLAIPAGKTKSYAAVAKAIGNPKAVRAVGSACGNNPISYIIPCHRVLASNGGIGGYRSGLAVKEALLAAEQSRAK